MEDTYKILKLVIEVDERVVKIKNKLKNELFIIMFNSNKEYKYITSRIKKLKRNNYIEIDTLNSSLL